VLSLGVVYSDYAALFEERAVHKNCVFKKGKVRKLGRAGERRRTPSVEIPSGVDKSLSQALINLTKTYVTTPGQDQPH
jgi:hypothetical protein